MKAIVWYLVEAYIFWYFMFFVQRKHVTKINKEYTNLIELCQLEQILIGGIYVFLLIIKESITCKMKLWGYGAHSLFFCQFRVLANF
jgi:hypothetical protein